MTILLDTPEVQAQRQEHAIRTFMFAIGRAQADVLREGLLFARAESGSISSTAGQLSLDGQRAAQERGRHGVSWIYARLLELAEATTATVQLRLVGQIRGGAVFGVTRPDTDGYALPGREFGYLPGPFTEVEVTAATLRGIGTTAPRTDLDIGRTLVHELVVHAWRDISYYQPPVTAGRQAPRSRESRHRAPQHAMAVAGTPHNLADAEADLIDLYWDIEMARNAPDYRPPDSHARSIARQLGGVSATPIIRLDADHAGLRRAAAELRRERLRFLEERLRFADAVQRAQAQDRSVP